MASLRELKSSVRHFALGYKVIGTAVFAAAAMVSVPAFAKAPVESLLSVDEVQDLFQCGSNIKKNKKKPILTISGRALSDENCECVYQAVSQDMNNEYFIPEVQRSADGILFAYDVKVKELAENPWRSLIVVTALKKVELIEGVKARIEAENNDVGTTLSKSCDLSYMAFTLEDLN